MNLKRYNSDLANDYGNLINRVTMLIGKYYNCKIPKSYKFDEIDLELISIAKSTPPRVQKNFETMKIHDAIEITLSMIRKINQFLEIREPWKLLKSKNNNNKVASKTLYLSIEILRIGSQLLQPIMPLKCNKILSILGAKNISLNDFNFGVLQSGQKIEISSSLFPRIDI